MKNKNNTHSKKKDSQRLEKEQYETKSSDETVSTITASSNSEVESESTPEARLHFSMSGVYKKLNKNKSFNQGQFLRLLPYNERDETIIDINNPCLTEEAYGVTGLVPLMEPEACVCNGIDGQKAEKTKCKTLINTNFENFERKVTPVNGYSMRCCIQFPILLFCILISVALLSIHVTLSDKFNESSIEQINEYLNDGTKALIIQCAKRAVKTSTLIHRNANGILMSLWNKSILYALTSSRQLYLSLLLNSNTALSQNDLGILELSLNSSLFRPFISGNGFSYSSTANPFYLQASNFFNKSNIGDDYSMNGIGDMSISYYATNINFTNFACKSHIYVTSKNEICPVSFESLVPNKDLYDEQKSQIDINSTSIGKVIWSDFDYVFQPIDKNDNDDDYNYSNYSLAENMTSFGVSISIPINYPEPSYNNFIGHLEITTTSFELSQWCHSLLDQSFQLFSGDSILPNSNFAKVFNDRLSTSGYSWYFTPEDFPERIVGGANGKIEITSKSSNDKNTWPPNFESYPLYNISKGTLATNYYSEFGNGYVIQATALYFKKYPPNGVQNYTFYVKNTSTTSDGTTTMDIEPCPRPSSKDFNYTFFFSFCFITTLEKIVIGMDQNITTLPVLDTQSPLALYSIFTVPSIAAVPNIEGLELIFNQTNISQQLDDLHKDQTEQYLIITIIVVICVLFSALIFSYAVSIILSRPMKRLIDYLDRIKRLEFGNGQISNLELTHSKIREINNINNALIKMGGALDTFGRYVPTTVVRNIIVDKKFRKVRVKRKQVTTMFSDVEGFTSISELLEVEDLMFLMTTYLTAMVSIVEQYEGAVAEIQGDGLLAFWNTPDDCANHCSKALAAALAQQEYVKVLSQFFNKELKSKYKDLPPLNIRIGLHTAEVLTGVLGSDIKMKFGCIGDGVNLASRLEGLCKLYGVNILCSKYTLDNCSYKNVFSTRELDLVQVKGKKIPIKIFEVIQQKEKLSSLFKLRDFTDPKKIQEELKKQDEPALLSTFFNFFNIFKTKCCSKSKENEAKNFENTLTNKPTAPRSVNWLDSSDDDDGKKKTYFDMLSSKFAIKKEKHDDKLPSTTRSSEATSLSDTENSSDRRYTFINKEFFPINLDDLESRENRAKLYKEALHFYQCGKFKNAKVQLETILDVASFDKAEKLLHERINKALEIYGDTLIDELWHGVNSLDNKSF